MFPNRLLLSLLLLIFGCPLAAQDTLVVVTEDGEFAVGANVELVAPVVARQVTDIDGRLVLPVGLVDTQVVQISYVGYGTTQLRVAELANSSFRFKLIPDVQRLREYVFVDRRLPRDHQPGFRVERLERAALEEAQPLSTADALERVPGVYVQRSQFGGGSPVLRGFEANRVLLMVDGVRMNNAIFRSGHLQNVLSVDPAALESVSVISGPGALSYGTDAIGGVIHFRTLEPVIDPLTTGWNGQVSLAGGTAAGSLAPSLQLGYHGKRFASVTLLSSSFTSHLRSGARRPARFTDFGRRTTFVGTTDGVDREVTNADPDRQVGTAYNQYNLTQKFRFALGSQTTLTTNFQYSTTSDVPRYDALVERRHGQPRWARWDYGPQTRALAGLALHRTGGRWYDRLDLRLNHQLISEDRLQRRFGDPLLENSLVDVNATTLSLALLKDIHPVTLRYGFDLRHDAVDATARLTDVVTGQPSPTPVEPRYPGGGSTLSSAGAFADARFSLGRHLSARGGLRYNLQRLNARFSDRGPVAWPQPYLAGIRNDAQALTGTAALDYRNRGHQGRALLGQSFRAPNVDDFAKFRESNGFVSAPNPGLQPERATTLEAAYRFEDKMYGQTRGWIDLAAYHTWLTDAIVRAPGTLPGGEDFFLSRGDTLRLQTNVNAESARVYGFDLSAGLALNDKLTLSGDVHYLVGLRRQRSPDGSLLDLPQDHIPPPYGQVEFDYTLPTQRRDGAQRLWNFRLQLRGQLAKEVTDYAVGSISGSATDGYVFDRTGTADNLELTPVLPDGSFAGSYGWWTANIHLETTLLPRLKVQLKAENLLDRHYRTFASGVSAPGFNLGLTLRYHFLAQAPFSGLICQ